MLYGPDVCELIWTQTSSQGLNFTEKYDLEQDGRNVQM